MGEQISSYFMAGLGRVVGFLPNLISATLVFIIGYFLSRLIGALVKKILARSRFDGFVARHIHSAAARQPASAATGSTVFWIGILITLSMTAERLGLNTLAGGFNRILSYVPRVIVAAIIVAIAVALANVLADLVRDVGGKYLSSGVRIAVIALSVFMALDELGVARTVVMTTFTALLGAAAVAAAISWGVGSIPVARDYANHWSRSRRERLEANRPEEEYPEERRTNYQGEEGQPPTHH